MGFLKAQDAISGQEGTAYATINGQVEEMFSLRKLEATIEKKKKEIRTLGKRGDQTKANGYSGKGSLTMYYVTSMFRKLMLEYVKNGKDVYFDIQVTNNDPTSSVGKQTTVLRNVNLDKAMVALIDVEAEALEEDVDFTFDDFDILDEFQKPILG